MAWSSNFYFYYQTYSLISILNSRKVRSIIFFITCKISMGVSKSFVLFLMLIVLSLCSLEDITEENLDDIRSSKKIWLVYQTSSI